MAVRRIIRQGRVMRCESLWIFISPANVTLTAVGGTLITSLNASALALRPFTVVRTHLELYMRSDQSAAAEDQSCAFGACVVSD